MFKLLSFPGNNGPGEIPIQNGAQPGDLLLSVVNASGDSVDYTHYFLQEVQAPAASIGSPTLTFPFITQVINANLAGQAFIALVQKRNP